MESEGDHRVALSCKGTWARDLRGQSDQSWKKDFTPLFYYEQTRKEIEREDNITNQRLTWSVSIQSFLMAAVAFLVSGTWPPDGGNLRLVLFRQLALGAMGVAGLVAAYISFRGVLASREHIRRAKNDWHTYNRELKLVPELAPHLFGDGPAIAFGSKYALLIPRTMMAAWMVYLLTFFLVMGWDVGCNILKLFGLLT